VVFPDLRSIDRFEDLEGGLPVTPHEPLLDVGDSWPIETSELGH
jgi:hypothetical protein